MSADTVRVQRRFRVGRSGPKGFVSGKWCLMSTCVMHDGTQAGVAEQVSVYFISLFASRLETAFFTSRLHLLSAAFHWYLTSLFSTPPHTLACLNLWKTLFVEEVRISDEVRKADICEVFTGWSVGVLLSPSLDRHDRCVYWRWAAGADSLIFLVVINSSQTVRRRVTWGPEARRKTLSSQPDWDWDSTTVLHLSLSWTQALNQVCVYFPL